MSGNYSIEARSLGILGVASHDFWVLRGPDGNDIAELHGLAVDPQTGDPLVIGVYDDELRFFQYRRDRPEDDTYISADQDYYVVFTGTEEVVLSKWNQAVSAIPYLNSRHIPYTPFGVLNYPIWNSNSAYRLFGEVMGLQPHDFPGRWEPGIDNQLVDPTQLDVLSHWYNLPLRFLPSDATRITLEGNGDVAALEGYLNPARDVLIQRLNAENPEMNLSASQFRSIDIRVDPADPIRYPDNPAYLNAKYLPDGSESTANNLLIGGEGMRFMAAKEMTFCLAGPTTTSLKVVKMMTF